MGYEKLFKDKSDMKILNEINAPTHDVFWVSDWEIHPPYSVDLVPCDFRLFSKSKNVPYIFS